MLWNKRLQTARKSRKDRRLTVEYLERRALLSASPGLSAVFGPHGLSGYFGIGSYGSGGHGGTAVIAPVDYSVSVASQVQSGNLTAVKLTALGTNGRAATAYTGTANLTSSDSGATFYAASTSTTPITSVVFANGTATVYVKFADAGRQTVTATDSTTGSIAGSAGTLVTTPDVVTQYFTVLNPTVVSGSPTTVKIYAEDANGFVVKNYATPSDFALTSTDAKAVLPSEVVKFVNGVATVQVTFETGSMAGTPESLTAADNANKLTDTVSTSVVADAASQYSINLPSVVRAGQPVTAQVYAVDATGYIVEATQRLGHRDDHRFQHHQRERHLHQRRGELLRHLRVVRGRDARDRDGCRSGRHKSTAYGRGLHRCRFVLARRRMGRDWRRRRFWRFGWKRRFRRKRRK